MSNGSSYREIEKKYVLSDKKLLPFQVVREIESLFPVIKNDYGMSGDIFFYPPKESPFSFVRLRTFANNTGEITGKAKDKGSNTDRLEINVPCTDMGAAIDFMILVLGAPIMRLEKSYVVCWLSMNTNISVYSVVGDPRTFVEIESTSVRKVDSLYKKLATRVALTQVNESLFELFAKGKS